MDVVSFGLPSVSTVILVYILWQGYATLIQPSNKSSRVLTSAENLKRLEEKERETERKAQEKEERARKRESKKQLRHDPSTRPVPELGISEPFSQSEHKKFSHRYENGFNIATDPRYNAWLNAFHPPGDKNSTSCGNF